MGSEIKDCERDSEFCDLSSHSVLRDYNNIFIDKNLTAKLSDFWFCIAIPEGELYVEDTVKGVIGFFDPDYYGTMKATEKVDIYSFGVVMLVLLSGKAAVFQGPNQSLMLLKEHVCEVIERNGFEEIVDKDIWNDLVPRRSQVESFLRLALKCVRYEKEVPVSSMLEVAKELNLIEKLF